MNAGDCSVRVGELDKASNYLERALLIDPDDLGFKKYSNSYVGRNDRKSVDIFTKTLEQTEEIKKKLIYILI
ncbi:MAG: hypothetical protein CM1200mP1_08430 [Candidatus Neomarinimicrobiota bacterium]|nr:MAG: hypothetical protein CM1200mP1_08430 [Candidatus Neomarinimicrobiota bacterium]